MRREIILMVVCILFLTCIFNCTAAEQDSPRDSWQQPEKIMDAIGIKSGMTIGEAGAGEGYFTFRLSNRVGEKGKIYANDINGDALEKIEKRCAEDSISNIVTILGEVADPLFPAGELDMVVMMRAFHDFEKPIEWMKNVVASLKPKGRLVIIDLDPDKAKYGWDHFMSKEELLATMERTDFDLVQIETFLERDNIYIYSLPHAR
jgi:ubiquinone/menaquinone biosynthesis C-methylase UbiE